MGKWENIFSRKHMDSVHVETLVVSSWRIWKQKHNYFLLTSRVPTQDAFFDPRGVSFFWIRRPITAWSFHLRDVHGPVAWLMVPISHMWRKFRTFQDFGRRSSKTWVIAPARKHDTWWKMFLSSMEWKRFQPFHKSLEDVGNLFGTNRKARFHDRFWSFMLDKGDFRSNELAILQRSRNSKIVVTVNGKVNERKSTSTCSRRWFLRDCACRFVIR